MASRKKRTRKSASINLGENATQVYSLAERILAARDELSEEADRAAVAEREHDLEAVNSMRMWFEHWLPLNPHAALATYANWKLFPSRVAGVGELALRDSWMAAALEDMLEHQTRDAPGYVLKMAALALTRVRRLDGNRLVAVTTDEIRKAGKRTETYWAFSGRSNFARGGIQAAMIQIVAHVVGLSPQTVKRALTASRRPAKRS